MDFAQRRIRFNAWMLDWVIATVLVTPFVYFVMFDGGAGRGVPERA